MEVLFLKMRCWDWNLRYKKAWVDVNTHAHTHTHTVNLNATLNRWPKQAASSRVISPRDTRRAHAIFPSLARHWRQRAEGRGGRYLVIAAAYASLHTSCDRCVCVCVCVSWVESSRTETIRSDLKLISVLLWIVQVNTF